MPCTVERVCRERSRCVRMNLEGPLSAAAPTPTDHGWGNSPLEWLSAVGTGLGFQREVRDCLPADRRGPSVGCSTGERSRGTPAGLDITGPRTGPVVGSDISLAVESVAQRSRPRLRPWGWEVPVMPMSVLSCRPRARWSHKDHAPRIPIPRGAGRACSQRCGHVG